jgi:hemerythrin superfamily protein
MTDIIGPAKAIAQTLSTQTADALTFLKREHQEVADLFATFPQTRTRDQQEQLARKICRALKVHAQIEEEIFYPAARDALDASGDQMLNQAEVEHDVVKGLISSIEESTNDPLFEAEVKVLGEYVKHHVAEEENELFPKLHQADMDLASLGRALAARKEELLLEQREGADGADHDVSVEELEEEEARDGLSGKRGEG